MKDKDADRKHTKNTIWTQFGHKQGLVFESDNQDKNLGKKCK